MQLNEDSFVYAISTIISHFYFIYLFLCLSLFDLRIKDLVPWKLILTLIERLLGLNECMISFDLTTFCWFLYKKDVRAFIGAIIAEISRKCILGPFVILILDGGFFFFL